MDTTSQNTVPQSNEFSNEGLGESQGGGDSTLGGAKGFGEDDWVQLDGSSTPKHIKDKFLAAARKSGVGHLTFNKMGELTGAAISFPLGKS